MPGLGGLRTGAIIAFLAASILRPAPTLAADNFAINNATGTFTVISCTEAAGVCTLNVVPIGGTVTTVPTTGTGGQNAVTVTNTSAQILAARVAPQYALSIKNESTTESIAFCFGAACTAALNTAGSITLAPGQLYSESPTFIHLDRINGISSAATSPSTIQAN